MQTRISLYGLSFLAVLSHAQPTPLAANGALKVCGLQLCNQHGSAIQLRGISTHGLQWYPWGDCLNEGSLDVLARDWGADVLRLSMYMQEGGWTTDPTRFTAMVDRLVDEAKDRGMYAIIDFHQLSPGDPMDNLANAKSYFEHMAATHGAKGHVIYEICNEPNGSGVNWARIKSYADQVIPIIRKHDAKSPILVGTPGWSSLGVSGGGPWTDIANNPLSDPNVLYVFHFYAASHGDLYRTTVRNASARLPLFVSEFGTQTASGDGTNDWASSRAWMNLLAEKKISWVNWNFSDDFRSGAVLKANTCPNGPWKAPALKPAGDSIFKWMHTPPDNFPGGTPIGPRGDGDRGGLGSKVVLERSASRLRIGLKGEGAYAVSLHSLTGKSLADFRGIGPRELTLPAKGIPAGAYWLRVKSGGEDLGRLLVF